jgi:fibronectin-binding autotransporter adhesin
MHRHLREFLRKATAIVAMAAIVSGQAHASPVTITQWTFAGDVLTPSTGSGTASNIGGTSSAFAAGNGSGTRAWNTSTYPAKQANSGTAGVQFLFSTVGYENLTFSYDHRASGTGSRWAQLDYTLNGTDWITGFWNNNGGLAPHDNFYTFNVDLSSITGANDNDTFGVRIVSIFSPQAFNENSVNSFDANSAYMRANNDAKYAPTAGVGTSTQQYASGGTWRFDNVTLSGSPAGAADLVWGGGSGDWNTSASNWTANGNPAVFRNLDTATFSDSAGGTITVDAGGVRPGTTVIDATAGTFSFTGGEIGGTGALTKSGAGTAVLAAANSYSGGTTISGGVLQANSDAALGGGAITLDGGTLRAGGPITGSRAITVAAGGGTIDTNGNATTVAAVTGPGDFTKAGAGTLTATGFSAGGLNVSSGTMRINAAGATPLAAGTIAGVLELGGAQRFNLGTGALGGAGTIRVVDSLAGLNTAGSGIAAVLGSNIELNPANAENFVLLLHPTSGNTITVNGVISGSAAVQFSVGTNGGAGVTTLNAQNTYTGATFLNMAASGVLRMGTNNALPAGSVVTLGASYDGLNAQDRGTIDLAGYDLTVGGLASVFHASTRGIGNTSDTLATLTVNQASDTTFHAQIGSGFASTTNMTGATPNIALVKAGAGKLTLTSTESNYSGGTTISAGTLSISADENLGGSAGGITLGGGTLEFTDSFTLGSGRTITAAAGTASTLAVTSGTVTFGGAFAGSGNLDKAGVGRLVVSNASSDYTGLFTISAGTLEVTGQNAFANATLSQTGGTLLLAPAGGGDVTIPDLDGSGGTTTIGEGVTAVVGGPGNSSYNGRVRGQGGLRKEGAGELRLNGDNDFAGPTRIAQGRLKLGPNGALSQTPLIDIDAGAILDLSERVGFILGTGQRLGGQGSILGDLEFGSGSFLTLDPTQPNAPLLVGSGTISFAEGFGLGNIFGLDGNTPEGIYTLLNETTGGSISFANLANVGPDNPFDLGEGRSAYFQRGSLQVVVVPEPDTVVLCGVGIVLAGWAARRRTRRQG